MNKDYTTISSKVLFENPYWKYCLDTYTIDNRNFEYHYVNSNGSVIIIPKLSENLFLLTKQFRYLNSKESIEFPGGGVPLGLSYESAAIKELEEETGFTTNDLTYIGEFNPFNGVTNEICKVFEARNLRKIEAKPDLTEKISIIELELNEINNLISSNKIWDGMSITSLYIYVTKTNGLK